ncbi:hypothetical protein ACZ87_03289, partial [Candidatus Erwinia dacicola]
LPFLPWVGQIYIGSDSPPTERRCSPSFSCRLTPA